MKTIVISLKIFLFLTILTGVIYPLMITGIGQLAFSDKANGSIIYKDNKAIGSSMLRHIFLTDKYGDTLEQAEKDAKEMAHSSGMQKDYIKKPKAIVVTL